MSKVDKIKIAYSLLSDSIYLYRHGKDPNLALEKRDAEADVMAVLIESMMHDAPKGAIKNVSFGDKKFKITVEPVQEIERQKPVEDATDCFYDYYGEQKSELPEQEDK